MTSASGHALQPLGMALITFKLGHHTFTHKFQVVRNMWRAVIIGSDFLTEYKASLDFERNIMLLKWGTDRTEIVALKPKDSNSEVNQITSTIVKTKNKMCLPPYTAVKVKCQLPKGQNMSQNNLHCLLTAFEDDLVIPDQPGLILSDQVVRAGKNTEAWVMNHTDVTYTLPKGYPLAHLQSVSECEVSEIEEKTLDCHDSQFTPVSDSCPPTSSLQMASPEEKKAMEALLKKYDHLFAENDLELGRTNVVEMTLDTGDSPPVRQKPYRTPLAQREVVEEHIKSMLEAGIIRPSTSPWASPLVVVTKATGGKRICADYRQVNRVLKMNSYPLPNIDDIWPALKGAKYFSSLDLRAGYWQVGVAEADKPKTAIVTHQGLYEFNVMPFGLSTAPPAFQNLMDKVLGDTKGIYALAYLDDLIIWAPTFDLQLQRLEDIFKRLEKAGLKLKRSKCTFLTDHIKYLGHIVTPGGLKPDPEKVEAISKLQPPCSVKDIRSFIGSTSYYRRFIPLYAEIAKPLICLTKKYSSFVWEEPQQLAFDTLKEKLMTAPVLAYADPKKPYRLYTDSSQYAVGAILTQEGQEGERPIYYLSHQLSPTQQRWPTIEREMYAIIYAIIKLRSYLVDAKFTVVTDHKPLKHLFTAEMKNPRVQRWAVMMEEYNCNIEWAKGAENFTADLLSRQCSPENDPDDTIEVDVIDNRNLADRSRDRLSELDKIPDVETIDPLVSLTCAEDFMHKQHEDAELQPIIFSLLQGEINAKHVKDFVLQDNILYHVTQPTRSDFYPRLQLVIPKCMQQAILVEIHSSDHAAHVGIEKSYEKARPRYYWKNMYKDLVQFIERCTKCQTRKLRPIRAPLQEMPIPQYPFQIIGIDLCGPYPETPEGARYVFTVTDHFSSWPEAYPINNKSAQTIAAILLEKVIPTHSCPNLIISDRGTEFNNSLVQLITEKMRVSHIRTSPYHPEGNGKCERFHRFMVDSLAKLMLKDPDQTSWAKYLPSLLLAYRTSIQSSTRFTPFFLMYGRDPVLPMDTLLQPTVRYEGDDYVPTMLQRMHRAFVHAQVHMEEARKRNKDLYDRKAESKSFTVGDAVYYQDKASQGTKLSPTWLPFFRIVEQLSPVNFRIKDQLTGQTRVVHVNKIHPAHPENVWDKEREAYGTFLSSKHQEEPVRTQPMRAAKLAAPTRVERLPRNGEDVPTVPVQRSEDEDNIPLALLAQRLREQDKESAAPSTTHQRVSVQIRSEPRKRPGEPSSVSLPEDKRICLTPGWRKRPRGVDNEMPLAKRANLDVMEPDELLRVDMVEVNSSKLLRMLRFFGLI